MNRIIKKTLHLLIPFKQRARIFWKLQSIKFLIKTPLISLRSIDEEIAAEKFNDYYSGLSQDERNAAISKLKKNLDDASQKMVDNFIFRQSYILRHNFLEQKKIFNEEEIKEQQECSKIINKINKNFFQYDLPEFLLEVFYGLSGVKWLPAQVKEILKNGIFIDAGAYNGDTALVFDFFFKPKKIYAFEPEKNNFVQLQKNVQIQGKKNIMPINLGLSNQEKVRVISEQNACSHIANKLSGQKIKLIDLDNFYFQNISKSEKIGFIKMDIEGEEINALQGARNIIKKYRPVLAISIYHRPEDFFQIKPWLENLCPEYKFQIKKAHPFSLTREVILLAYPQKYV